MKDKDFLKWLHRRLVEAHGEKELYDYMHKLRSIIYHMDPKTVSPNNLKYNSLAALEGEECSTND